MTTRIYTYVSMPHSLIYIFIYLSNIHLFIYLTKLPSTYQSLIIYLCTSPFFYISIYLSFHLFNYLLIYLLSIYLSIYLIIYLSIYLSIYLYLSIFLFICIKLYKVYTREKTGKNSQNNIDIPIYTL